MKNKKYILFDLDGTVTNSMEGITKAVQYAMKHFGVTVSDRSELSKFIGPPLRKSFQNYFNLTEEEAETAVSVYREYYNDIGIFENEVYEGMTELLKELKEAEKQIILATCKPKVYADRILEHFHLNSYFDFVCGSELDGTRSNKWEVIKCVLQTKKITDLSEVVMIGDRKDDMIGARKNQIDSIGVLYGFGTKSELLAAGGRVIASDTKELKGILLG